MRFPFSTTLTGVDEFADIERIEDLSFEFPFVEWGILYSETASGSFAGRYPSSAWFEANAERLATVAVESGCSLAMHVCGKKAISLILSQEDCLLKELTRLFDRIQLNLRYSADDLIPMRQLLSSNPSKDFITQRNKANVGLAEALDEPNHRILFDSSGGRGALAVQWPTPLPNKTCGYAGGLGPDNVEIELPKIFEASHGRPFWIDMESRVRTDEKLDLSKCEQVLRSVSAFRKRTPLTLSAP